MSRKKIATDGDVDAPVTDAPEATADAPEPRMMLDAQPEMVIPAPLGPGDDDPRETPRVVVPVEAQKPLGPGDDDPTFVPSIATAGTGRGPLKPGETDPTDTRPPFLMLVQPQAGPGDVAMPPRRITVFPIDSKE